MLGTVPLSNSLELNPTTSINLLLYLRQRTDAKDLVEMNGETSGGPKTVLRIVDNLMGVKVRVRVRGDLEGLHSIEKGWKWNLAVCLILLHIHTGSGIGTGLI
uniref:Uncharacterized protein n=1 Tax=Cacopsylla melanoneura TaxID=428564 RepID=A0A8D8R8B7_9HEMI